MYEFLVLKAVLVHIYEYINSVNIFSPQTLRFAHFLGLLKANIYSAVQRATESSTSVVRGVRVCVGGGCEGRRVQSHTLNISHYSLNC